MRGTAAIAVLVILPAACAPEPAPPAEFADVFVPVRSVALEEPANAVIGDLGAHAAGAGVWAVIDRQAAELRLHDPSDGRLLGRPAVAGEGPGELRRPSDVAIHGTTIERLDAIGDVLLVTHGGFVAERDRSTGAPFRRTQRTIDAYTLDGARLWSDIALPGRVLGAADDTLYLLTTEPPSPWTITLYTLRR